MQCNEVKERTVPYLELDLDASRVRDMTVHLEGCAECRIEMEAVRQVLVRVKAHAVPDPGEQFWREFPEGVRSQLAQARGGVAPMKPPVRPRSWRGKLKPVWPLGLAASVMLLAGAWLLTGPPDERVAQRGQPPAASIKTTEGSGPHTQQVTLEPDLPTLDESDWDMFEDDDPDTILVDMAARLDRRAVDRLFREI
jgi:hypothetical protein